MGSNGNSLNDLTESCWCEDMAITKSPYYDLNHLNEFKKAIVQKNSGNAITVMHLNVRGLQSKIDDLKLLVHALNLEGIQVDAIMLCETFMKHDTTPLMHIDGYQLISNPRTHRKGGGVAIYIRDGLTFHKVDQMSLVKDGVLETIFIKTKLHGENVMLGEFYRIPGRPLMDCKTQLDPILTDISNFHGKVIVGSDHNINLLTIDHHTQAQCFLQDITAAGLAPCITKPTRVTETSSTLIDNLFSKNTLSTTAGILTSYLSDHFPVIMSSHMSGDETDLCDDTPRRYITTKKIVRISEQLINTDWSILHSANSNDAFNVINKKLLEVLDKITPLTRPKKLKKKKVNWMTPELKKLTQKLNKLYARHLNERTVASHDAYVEHRQLVNKERRKAKADYYKNKLVQAAHDGKRKWRILNEITGKVNKKTQTDHMIVQGSKNFDSTDIANLLNDYFCDIGQRLTRNMPNQQPSCDISLSEQSFFLTPTTYLEVYKAIGSLKSSVSESHNGISNNLVKKLSNALSLPLSIAINKSFLEGSFPTDFKIAKVTPIHKGGTTTDPSNYRPIAVLHPFSKVIEKIVCKRLQSYFLNTNKFQESQYGFRPGLGTSDAVFNLVQKIRNNSEGKKMSVGVYLDLKKAFDTVNHELLLYKLNRYGIRGIALDWFRSYLGGRTQYTIWGNGASFSKRINIGVPQGSVLGPVLFSVYVNDLSTSVRSCVPILYADDTALVFEGRDVQTLNTKIANDLDRINEWLLANKLIINVEKSAYQTFGISMHKKSGLTVKIDNKTINECSTYKYLGIYIDNKLKWSKHIQHVCDKVTKNLYILNSVKALLPLTHRLTLYRTLIESHIQYGYIIWCEGTRADWNKLELLQKKAIRSVACANYLDHTTPLFGEFGVLKLYDVIQIVYLAMAYRLVNLKLTTEQIKVIIRDADHNYDTRRQSINSYFSGMATRIGHVVLSKNSHSWHNKTYQQHKKELKQQLISEYKS